MNLKDILYSEILPRVRKPSRYLGTELNAVHKDPADVDLRMALVFPELYDLGLGNIGILILYDILNALPWCWCERAYAVAEDMEAELRERGLPLFCSESKEPLAAMDLVGFTLQSELTYTNVLNCIDLAGFPLRSADRAEDAPLFFAGGPTVFNPEPLAPFIDFFVVGDGEDVVVEIAECARALTGAGRREKLQAMAEIAGVYVPALYPMDVMPDGRILPAEDGPKIVKRLVRSLDEAKFPARCIVPYTQQVHDRLSLEVLRGCTQGCRFCQAGMVTRPVRERSLDTVDRLMEESLAQTGYEEVSLLSLSTCDYSRPRALIERSARRAAEGRVSVALPSLRLDSFSIEMADLVAGMRRSGLTFAPEAATPRLRAVINKWIPDADLLDMAVEAFRRNWTHVKCYFMVGLPTERDEDLEAIVELCKRTLEAGRSVNPKARVRLGVSTFSPKPFTPFQWARQIDMEETERRQGILDRGFKSNDGIKFGRHASKTTFIEGLIARSDRRAADLIEAAWRRGARFESWDELCNLDAWLEAIEETGFDAEDALRERSLDERLPWDHIDVLIPKQWFQEEWGRAMALEHAPDCRAGVCHLCGVISRERELCQHMLLNQRLGRIEERDRACAPKPQYTEAPAVQRLRFRIGREGETRFLSHLELMNAWIRALRRAQAPLSYSQGFHAHPKVTFSAASPVGEESTGDYMDVILKARVETDAFVARLQATLPSGFQVFEVVEVPLKTASLMSAVEGFSWTFETSVKDSDDLERRIDEILAADEVLVERAAKAKRGGRGRKNSRGAPARRAVNIRPLIAELALSGGGDESLTVHAVTRMCDGKLAKAKELLEVLGLDPHATRVVKTATYLAGSEGDEAG